jgi:hypothetical protein
MKIRKIGRVWFFLEKWIQHVFFSSPDESPMKSRDYLLLFITALIVAFTIAALQPVPGYLDADYYYANGTQLASGNGFQEPFIWNYLDNPEKLPHPSNAYWYPLASMIAAGGMALTSTINFNSARIGFVIMAVLAPLMVTTLAFKISNRRPLALLSGVLAIFSGFYLPFIVTTDNYSLYLLVGAIYFILLERLSWTRAALLGFLASILNFARADGLIWLPLTFLAVVYLAYKQSIFISKRIRFLRSVLTGSISLIGYLPVMGMWMLRNMSIFGTLMPPGSGHMLWMTSYNQIFSYTPEIFTYQSWMASGWQLGLIERGVAFLKNLSTAFFAQGMIVIFPLVVIGIYDLRYLVRVQVGVLGWIVLVLTESLLFPFASVRGGFFHAGTAFQPLWFALAPIGLEVLLTRLSKKNILLPKIAILSRLSLAIIVIVFSAMLIKIRVIDSGWNEGEYLYKKVDEFLVRQNARPEDVVMTRNPPAYFIMTGRRAIVVPFGNVQTILDAARKFGVSYIILERISTYVDLTNLFDQPSQYPDFEYLGSIDETIILKVISSK